MLAFSVKDSISNQVGWTKFGDEIQAVAKSKYKKFGLGWNLLKLQKWIFSQTQCYTQHVEDDIKASAINALCFKSFSKSFSNFGHLIFRTALRICCHSKDISELWRVPRRGKSAIQFNINLLNGQKFLQSSVLLAFMNIGKPWPSWMA